VLASATIIAMSLVERAVPTRQLGERSCLAERFSPARPGGSRAVQSRSMGLAHTGAGLRLMNSKSVQGADCPGCRSLGDLPPVAAISQKRTLTKERFRPYQIHIRTLGQFKSTAKLA